MVIAWSALRLLYRHDDNSKKFEAYDEDVYKVHLTDHPVCIFGMYHAAFACFLFDNQFHFHCIHVEC